MTLIRPLSRLGSHAASLRKDSAGSTLVEFGLVLAIFLLIFFGLIDFGRLAFHYVAAERAVHVAARVAAVRPAACAGVPQFNARGTTAPNTTPARFGTNCSASAGVCFNPGVVTCTGAASNTTAAEIWALLNGALPNEATIANLRFSYAYDNNLGFLGGPYVPIVTVELQNLFFEFVSPLGELVSLAGGTPQPGLGAAIAFPTMSVSLPAEDLATGTSG